jgi:hypothetical protein
MRTEFLYTIHCLQTNEMHNTFTFIFHNAAISWSLQNTAQQHATDNYTSHLRRKQDQLPIILNNFK